MQGLQLTADLGGCDGATAVMREPAMLRATCLAAVRDAGLTAVADVFHRFDGAAPPPAQADGITGVVVLAESHLAVHTWPEIGAATLDVYVCNRGGDNSQRAEALLGALIDAFAPASTVRHAQRRG